MQGIQEVAEQLGERHRLGRDVFSAHATEPEKPSEEDRQITADLTTLLHALRDVLRSAPASEYEETLVKARGLADALGAQDLGAQDLGVP